MPPTPHLGYSLAWSCQSARLCRQRTHSTPLAATTSCHRQSQYNISIGQTSHLATLNFHQSTRYTQYSNIHIKPKTILTSQCRNQPVANAYHITRIHCGGQLPEYLSITSTTHRSISQSCTIYVAASMKATHRDRLLPRFTPPGPVLPRPLRC